MTDRCIAVDAAATLLDFRGRPDGVDLSAGFAQAQLDGAVAAHNLLQSTGLAYVADEVGTGKTLVAAGALALLRHQDPSLRALVIAPRANLQRKWSQELREFALHNIRYRDLRVRGLGSELVRPTRITESLREVLTTWQEEPDTDVIARLSSFSLPFRESAAAPFIDSWRALLGAATMPTVSQLLDRAARKPTTAKEVVAACANRLLPAVDVLVVDEAHNLKGGTGGTAARNRVLWTFLGHNPDYVGVVPGYGPRAMRVLLLSATPMEDSTAHLAGQLDVVGATASVPGFADASESQRLTELRTFLFRRLTKLVVSGQPLTRNRYREEWRSGGTTRADSPLSLGDDRGKLTFALVQKRVADALNHSGGTRRLQIGMLTSFESLAASAAQAKATQDAAEEQAFDDTEQNQAADEDERVGIDRIGVRALVESHQREFGRPPSHPKMDAEVRRIVENARRGRKTLVFTRRVASVDELVQRVNNDLDDDLRVRLAACLPSSTGADVLWEQYQRSQDTEGATPSAEVLTDDDVAPGGPAVDEETPEEELRAGESLFHWLFRKRNDEGLLTGYWLRQRLEQGSGAYRTLLEDNLVAAVLQVPAHQATAVLARELKMSADEAQRRVDELGARFLGASAEPATIIRFRAAQRAGLQLLAEQTTGDVQRRAAICLAAQPAAPPAHAGRRPVALDLDIETLATQLRLDPKLCAALWHDTLTSDWRDPAQYADRRWRWELLTTTLRFDAPALDLWLAEVRRHGRLESRGHQPDQPALIEALLAELRRQRDAAPEQWTSYRALTELAADAPLVLQVNGVDRSAQGRPAWMGSRAPAVGMSGRVNLTAVQQFRSPTYPLIIITTDLLQEGEDLHTFCDEVHHYGMAWMPSSLEQRTGRVDRVNSLTERRLTRSSQLGDDGRPPESDRLNVLYPFISGTYEEVQARTVLRRLDEHVRLLHSPFGSRPKAVKHLDVDAEITHEEQPTTRVENLEEPYPINPDWLLGTAPFPAVGSDVAEDATHRFNALASATHVSGLAVWWLSTTTPTHLVGEVRLGTGRVQPLDLRLTSHHGHAAIRVTSPIGRLSARQLQELTQQRFTGPARIGAVRLGPKERRSFTATAEDVVLLPPTGDLVDAVSPSALAVLTLADSIELEHLGSDLAVGVFADDLAREVQRG